MLKLKKILSIFLIIILSNTLVFANEVEEEQINQTELQEIIGTSANVTTEPQINSRAAIVILRNSKQVLYEKEAYEKRAMASTTKIMTAIVALEHGDLNDVVEVSKKAAWIGGSCINLKTGDKITLHDLLYGLMLRSGNDAAISIAEYLGGSVEGFAELMNTKARELNLLNTHFITPHGLDKSDHYTTAYELALLTDYALNIEKFADIVNTKTYTITINNYTKTISNTNELLGNLNGVNGVKTGFTNNAGRCLVTSVKRGNLEIISVVLGADTKKLRTSDSIKIIEYTYSNYEIINIKEMIEKKFENWKKINEKRILVEKGIIPYLEIYLEELPYTNLAIDKNIENNVDIKIENETILHAPLEKDIQIGTLNVMIGNEEMIELEILTEHQVLKKGIFDYMLQLTNKIYR